MLTDLPGNLLTIMQDDDWPNPSATNHGTPGVARRGLPLRSCRQPYDTIDLRSVRANGFRVVSYRIDDGSKPSGYKIAGYSNVRPFKHANATDTRLLNAHDPAEIDTISVTPQTRVLDVVAHGKPQRLGCVATWALEVHVIGPEGVDPYTGNAK